MGFEKQLHEQQASDKAQAGPKQAAQQLVGAALLGQQGLGLRVGHMLALVLQKQVHQTRQFWDENIMEPCAGEVMAASLCQPKSISNMPEKHHEWQ